MKKLILFSVLLAFVLCCKSDNNKWVTQVSQASHLHNSVKKLTDVIVHDIFSPPVASRIYAYPSIAAYEILRQGDSTYKSLSGQLRELKDIPQANSDVINFELAALDAFLTVGTSLIFSENKMKKFRDELYEDFKSSGLPPKILLKSQAYADEVSRHILAWADKDNYKQTRTFPKYEIRDLPGRWIPTPPDYMQGIEPHWREIRPFVIDSAEQFKAAPPPAFNMQKESSFYHETMVVYNTTNELEEEQIEIAKFWDCNPFVSTHKGHFMFGTKKISPGGHWMGITTTVSKKANDDMLHAARSYALVSVALADGFIACWDEKYKSNLIRPETVINEHIDEDWFPILQTPPFPEHTSGHSVISSSAATALTSIYGEAFAYVDSVEVEFGLPPRSFSSFFDASSEAAISRLYGGIHYIPAIEDGVDQGRKVGDYVVSNISFK